MSELKTEFQGFEEFSKILKDLSKRTGRKVFVRAFNSAINHMSSELKQTSAWADQTGELRSGLTVKKGSRRGAVTAGISGNYYGRFLEFGWIPGRRPGTRAARASRVTAALNFVPARPWVRPVFERDKDKLIQMILTDLQNEVLSTVAKHKSRGRKRG